MGTRICTKTPNSSFEGSEKNSIYSKQVFEVQLMVSISIFDCRRNAIGWSNKFIVFFFFHIPKFIIIFKFILKILLC